MKTKITALPGADLTHLDEIKERFFLCLADQDEAYIAANVVINLLLLKAKEQGITDADQALLPLRNQLELVLARSSSAGCA